MFKIKDNKRRSEAYSLTMSLRNHGLTQKQIAQNLNIDHSIISRRLKKLIKDGDYNLLSQM